jgi:hypothetical protein
METAGSLYAISAGVSAIAGSPASSVVFDALANWWQRRKLRHSVRGLVVLKGVTTLTQKLTTPECVYIDVDTLYQQLTVPKDAESLNANQPRNPVDDLLAFSVIKRHILNITQVWKNKIVFVSKNLELLKTLPIRQDNIYFGAFSKDCEKNIGGIIYPNEAEHHQAEIQKFRVMRELPEEKVFICDTMKELYEKTAEIFGTKICQL